MSNVPPVNGVASNGVGVVADSQLNTFVQTDSTAAQLRSFVGLSGMCVVLQGFVTSGDGGAGTFYWNSGSGFVDDGGITTIVPPAASTGAWLRLAGLYAAPRFTVAGLPVVGAANAGAIAFATNGRNTGQTAGAGTGTLVTVSNAGVWIAVWSGVAVTS